MDSHIMSVRNHSSFRLFLTSIYGVFFFFLLGSPFTEATEQLPLKSHFCVALFDTNARLKEESKTSTSENQDLFPIKTMIQSFQFQQASSQTLMKTLMKSSKDPNKDLLQFQSTFERMNKEYKYYSPMKFDSRIFPHRVNHEDINLSILALSQRQTLTDLVQRKGEYFPLEFPLADIHEIRGQHEILNYLRSIQEQSKEWQNLTRSALEEETNSLSKMQKHILRRQFTINAMTTYLLTFTLLNGYLAWNTGHPLALTNAAISILSLAYFRKDLQKEIKNTFQFLKAKLNPSDWNKYLNQSWNGTQDATNFLQEIEMIFSGQSAWSPSKDYIYLHESFPTTAELGKALAFGPNHQDYTQDQLVLNEKHFHQAEKLTPDLWGAGYSFYFSYLPKQKKESVSIQTSVADDQDLEPVLLVSSYLIKSNLPPTNSQPKGKGPKIPVDKELKWDEGLAPAPRPIPIYNPDYSGE